VNATTDAVADNEKAGLGTLGVDLGFESSDKSVAVRRCSCGTYGRPTVACVDRLCDRTLRRVDSDAESESVGASREVVEDKTGVYMRAWWIGWLLRGQSSTDVRK